MWSQANIQANGIQIHYFRTGGHKAPLILAHGHTDSALVWGQTAKVLEADYDVIMPDARGHGSSERVNKPFTTDDLARDILGLMDALEIDHAGLMGHSMGASTVAVSALLAPQKVDYVILVDPPWFDSPPNRIETQAERAKNHKELVSQTLDDLIERGRDHIANAHEDLLKAWAQSKLILDPQIFEMMQTESRFFSWREVIPHIECPILLLTGEAARGGLVTPQVATAIQSEWKQGQWVQINGTGHLITFEQHQAMMKAVQAFLEEVKP